MVLEGVDSSKWLCRTSPDPDLWFPELPVGRLGDSKRAELIADVYSALYICSNCPSQDSCAYDGFDSKNLPYGIWGGLTAAERLHEAGYAEEDFPPDSPEGIAFILARAVGR